MDRGVSVRMKRAVLESLYLQYSRREFISPDPLEFLYQYDGIEDREIVGMIASSLAYGRVFQICKCVRSVLEIMGPAPYTFIENATYTSLVNAFHAFRYRFTTGDELAALLWGIKGIIEKHGSLHRCFTAYLADDDETIEPALGLFVRELRCGTANGRHNTLIPDPVRGSACKRLNLFLRWQVRRDAVDPGGWEGVPPSKLIVPLDTHMHRLCLMCNITKRKQADMRTALEITRYFRQIFPDDPVRCDFALTRLGIRDDTDVDSFLSEWHGVGNRSVR